MYLSALHLSSAQRVDAIKIINMIIGCTICLYLTACGTNAPKGTWYSVQSGDTVSAISQKMGIPIEDLIEINQLTNPSKIIVGQRLFIPNARTLLTRPTQFISFNQQQHADPKQTSTESPISPERLKGHPPLHMLSQMKWPLKISPITITSPFGLRGQRTHKGLDLRAPIGTPSLSILSGRVVRVAYEKKGYGHYIVIDHGQGLESRYAHHHKNLVSEGEFVEIGTQIGEVGSTGRSSGPHLHFELRFHGTALDPIIYLPALP